MLPAGGQQIGGPEIAAVQGLPGVEAEVAWLVDAQELFQLELFRFRVPAPQRTARWPGDIGYAMLGLHVADFDDSIGRLRSLGSTPIAAPVGAAGARRVCVPDPDGVVVELAEDDPRGPERRDRPRPQVPCAVRWIRASVRSLEQAERFWITTLGLDPGDATPVHGPGHEAAWGLDGAARRVRTLWARDIGLELVRYDSPPARPWPAGYLISDLGIVNVALGGPERSVYERLRDRARDAGYDAGRELARAAVCATYVTDDQGFSVELLYRSAATAHLAGFEPLRATERGSNE